MTACGIEDMTCGHCIATITRAVASVDERAALRFDPPAHRLEIESGTASAQALRHSVEDAGHTLAASAIPAVAPRKGVCCFG